MPSSLISVYWKEDQYKQYNKKKKHYNSIGRAAAKKEVLKDMRE